MTDEKDPLAGAKEQGFAQFRSIGDMVEALNAAQKAENQDAEEAAREAIEQDALSVEVRSGWYTPSGKGEPEEFKILLCTGGPAAQIKGELGEHSEPSKAWIEVQDWFQPWTRLDLSSEENAEETLLAYARVFYWGE
jgi:hypothetical protein